jgi:hypothetical protein
MGDFNLLSEAQSNVGVQGQRGPHRDIISSVYFDVKTSYCATQLQFERFELFSPSISIIYKIAPSNPLEPRATMRFGTLARRGLRPFSRLYASIPERNNTMSSIAQITANRSNAAHSTGPRTELGKLAVAQNARKHGLSGAHVILHGERQEDYDALLQGLCAEHNASGITETFLTEQMAQAQWKLMRIARMQQIVLQPDSDMLARCPGGHPIFLQIAQFVNDCNGDQTALKLLRYETATRRAYMQSLRQLMALQKQRAASKSLPAQPVTQNHKTKPIPPQDAIASPAPSLPVSDIVASHDLPSSILEHHGGNPAAAPLGGPAKASR